MRKLLAAAVFLTILAFATAVEAMPVVNVRDTLKRGGLVEKTHGNHFGCMTGVYPSFPSGALKTGPHRHPSADQLPVPCTAPGPVPFDPTPTLSPECAKLPPRPRLSSYCARYVFCRGSRPTYRRLCAEWKLLR